MPINNNNISSPEREASGEDLKGSSGGGTSAGVGDTIRAIKDLVRRRPTGSVARARFNPHDQTTAVYEHDGAWRL